MINHIGVSGGKDSTALLLWAVHESGYDPKTIVASFCDTGNEAQETYDYVQMLSECVHPITVIKPERDFWELAKWKKRFPSAKARFCTEELKMKPSKLFMDALAAIGGGQEVIAHSGVRASESDDRALLPAREFSSYFKREVFRPLLALSIDDVWAMHDKYGIPRNPLYAKGCNRVGCLPCCLSRKAEVANISIKFPQRIDRIRVEENSNPNSNGFSGFFARDKIPVRYRSKEITTAKGETMLVASIDDAVKWAMNSPDLFTAEFDFFEDAPACDSRYGACE